MYKQAVSYKNQNLRVKVKSSWHTLYALSNDQGLYNIIHLFFL